MNQMIRNFNEKKKLTTFQIDLGEKLFTEIGGWFLCLHHLQDYKKLYYSNQVYLVSVHYSQ
jgi:hypothetical protein